LVDKAPDAFRTIGEVAEALGLAAHVLRFWESRFPQIRPVKGAGSRRYYRPADVALVTGISRLLYEQGMTIRGVQKILRDHGVRFVAGLAEPGSRFTLVPASAPAAKAPVSAELPELPGPPHPAVRTAARPASGRATGRQKAAEDGAIDAQQLLFPGFVPDPVAAPAPPVALDAERSRRRAAPPRASVVVEHLPAAGAMSPPVSPAASARLDRLRALDARIMALRARLLSA
jgi:DNA-binding transcriptional MerR regulator